MMLVMGGIFFVSHQPGSAIHLLQFPGSDKLAHALAYAVLAASVLFALPPSPRRPWRGLVLVFVVCSLYGISDEVHQSFIPLRSADPLDWLADSLGAGVFLLAWAAFQPSRSARAASRAK
ncbi:MAG: hypothetical protein BWK76_12655 [Desulfobulbaceae bacterium A2]|nr:MAG: hypothetical protein BWK76_12655 [Desulfobulbaceae bacterium A2]